MWEELTKLSVCCAKHEVVDNRCPVCAALVRYRSQLLDLKMKRDLAVREVRALVESKKAIITNFK